jgi:hypothetical protein
MKIFPTLSWGNEKRFESGGDLKECEKNGVDELALNIPS